MNRKFKKQHVFEIEILCILIVFNVIFDQSLLVPKYTFL